jgi:hypothetical protein
MRGVAGGPSATEALPSTDPPMPSMENERLARCASSAKTESRRRSLSMLIETGRSVERCGRKVTRTSRASTPGRKVGESDPMASSMLEGVARPEGDTRGASAAATMASRSRSHGNVA